MGLARAVLTRCMPSGAFACRGAGGGRGRTERDSLQRRRGQENAGSAPSPRHGWHPDLPVRHARAPFESMPSVVGRTQSAVDEREFDLCGRKQGGSDLGQLALQRPLSASGHASGCGEPRPASASLGQSAACAAGTQATSGLLSTSRRTRQQRSEPGAVLERAVSSASLLSLAGRGSRSSRAARAA